MKRRLLRVAGWLVAGIGTIRVLFGLVGLLLPVPTSEAGAPQAGLRIGGLIGLFFEVVIFGAIARGLLAASERAMRPTGKSWEREQLEAILAARKAELPSTAPEQVSAYESLSDRQLLDVSERIDARAHVERYRALLWVISRRVDSASPTEAAQQAAATE